MDDACELDIGTWRDRPHYTCSRCNIRTTTYDNAVARCQVTTDAQRITSETGLYGPDGALLPPPAERPEEGETSPDGEFLTHDQ